MGYSVRRNIGDILMDGGFLVRRDLDTALEEQKQTKELLGQVLVRKGVLNSDDIKVPLIIQEHLGSIESAVKIAAGARLNLGDLLVHSGQITCEQLDRILAEQKRTGEKIGEVCKRLGMLTDLQLNALLEYQRKQEGSHDSPLRLGELLVATGKITREHLEDALLKQKNSRKNLGVILIEAGYAGPSCIEYGARLQKMLTRSVLGAILALGMSTASDAGEMCLFTKQLQDSSVKAQYVAKVSSAVGNMVAYNSHSDKAVQSDAFDDATASGYFLGKTNTTVRQNDAIDSLSQDCLACHDGLVASPVHVNYRNTPGHRTNKYDGKGEHPIGMNYASYAAMDHENYKPAPSFNSKMIFVNGKVGCLTCHNPLNPAEKHLVMSDYRSALCTTCHKK